jgi:hypothetical protein
MRYLALVLVACGGSPCHSLSDAGPPDSGSDDAGFDAGPTHVNIIYTYHSENIVSCTPETMLTCDAGVIDDGGLPRWEALYCDAGCLVETAPGSVTFDCRGLCHLMPLGRGDNGTCCGDHDTYGRAPFTPFQACEWSPP